VVITVSRKGSILDWNKKSSDVGMALPRPRYKESYDHYRARLLESCNGVTSPHDDNIITTTINGVERHYLFTHHEIGYKGRIFGRLVEISEVTKSYSVLRYLEEIAMVDNLTGLRNRNAYIDAVKTILVPENMPLGIIVGDVNNLKRTNDVQGHLQGDRLLQSVSAIISDNMPAESSVFRIGGDELVLLIPRATPDVPQKFVNGVTAGCEAATDEIYGTPSISWGCALMTDLSQNYNEVFRAADAMMYENKCASKVVSLSGIVAE
jgi:diguanylate cyclase (GGDEF)-like protein